MAKQSELDGSEFDSNLEPSAPRLGSCRRCNRPAVSPKLHGRDLAAATTDVLERRAGSCERLV